MAGATAADHTFDHRQRRVGAGSFLRDPPASPVGLPFPRSYPIQRKPVGKQLRNLAGSKKVCGRPGYNGAGDR
jgi:hypothetical protein